MEGSQTLAEAIEKFGIQEKYGEISAEQVQLLADYCGMLWEWNERLNLTRHTSWDKFVSRDLVDTLELSQLLEPEETVLDVGTGGGVPGIPLAILRPDLTLALAGQVFGILLNPMLLKLKRTRLMVCSGWKCYVRSVMPT